MRKKYAHTFKNLAPFIVCALVAGCQTSGKDGVLTNVLPRGADQQQTQAGTLPADNTPVDTGINPYSKGTLANTRNSLTHYCPSVQIRAGTEFFRIYKKGADKEDKRNIRYQAAITKVARECSYQGYNLHIKVGIKGRVITGVAGKPGSLTMPIRVAVSEGGETVYSKLHKQKTQIDGATKLFAFVDDQIIIHAPKRTNVRIYIGFDEGPYNTP